MAAFGSECSELNMRAHLKTELTTHELVQVLLWQQRAGVSEQQTGYAMPVQLILAQHALLLVTWKAILV